MKLNRTKIGKALKFIGSLITLVITTFFVQSCFRGWPHTENHVFMSHRYHRWHRLWLGPAEMAEMAERISLKEVQQKISGRKFLRFLRFLRDNKESAGFTNFCDFRDFLRPFGSKRPEVERCVTILSAWRKSVKSVESVWQLFICVTLFIIITLFSVKYYA